MDTRPPNLTGRPANAGLPERQRRVLDLRYLGPPPRPTLDRIADQVGVSYQTCVADLRHALLNLRRLRRLAAEGVTLEVEAQADLERFRGIRA